MEKSISTNGRKFKELKKSCIVKMAEFLDYKTFMNFCFTKKSYKNLLNMDIKIIKLYKLFNIKSKVEFIREKLRYLQQVNPKIAKTNDLILKYLTSHETMEFLKNRFKFTREEIYLAGRLYLMEILEDKVNIEIHDAKYFETLFELKDIYMNYYEKNFNFCFNAKNENLNYIDNSILRIDTFEIPCNAYVSSVYNDKCEKILNDKNNIFYINKLILESYHNETTIERLIDLNAFVDFFKRKPMKLIELKISMLYITKDILDKILKIIELNLQSLRKISLHERLILKEPLKEILKKLKKCEQIKSLLIDKMTFNKKTCKFLKYLRNLKNLEKITLFFQFGSLIKLNFDLNELSKLLSNFKNSNFIMKVKIQIDNFNVDESKALKILEDISYFAHNIFDMQHSFNIFDLEEAKYLCRNRSNYLNKLRLKLYMDLKDKKLTGFHLKFFNGEKINKLRILNFNTHRKYKDLKEVLSINPIVKKVAFITNCKCLGFLSKENHFSLKVDRYSKDHFQMINDFIKQRELRNGTSLKTFDSFSLYFQLNYNTWDDMLLEKRNWIQYSYICENIKYLNIIQSMGYIEEDENDILKLCDVIECLVNLEFISFDYNVQSDDIWIKFSKCLRSLKKLKFLYFLFNTHNFKVYEKFNDQVANSFIQNINTNYINFISLRGNFSNVTLEGFKQNIHKFKFLTEFNIKGTLKLTPHGIDLIEYILQNTHFIANVLLDVEFVGNDVEKADCKSKMKELDSKYDRTFTINYL